MSVKKEQDTSPAKGLCKLVMNEDMTIYAIADIKQQLSEELEIHDSFEVDLSNVEEIDSSGIQLLLALKSELKHKQKKFRLEKISDAAAKLIEIYGLGDNLAIGGAA